MSGLFGINPAARRAIQLQPTPIAMTRSRSFFATLPLLSLALASGSVSAASLKLVDSINGTFNPGFLFPTGINDAGQMSGYGLNSSNELMGFIFQNGVFEQTRSDIGKMVSAYGINQSGQTVGYGSIDGKPSALLYDKGALTSINFPGATSTEVFSINDSGVAVGTYKSGSNWGVFTWKDGVATDVVALGLDHPISTTEINNAGDIAGGRNGKAFLYSSSVLTDVGINGEQSSSFGGMNDLGHVVGSSRDAMGVELPFLFKDGVSTLFGNGPGNRGYAVDINNHGTTIGFMDSYAGKNGSFVYENGKLELLNEKYASLLGNGVTNGFTSLAFTYAISENGLIAGAGTYFDGQRYVGRAFILDTRDSAQSVPDASATLPLFVFVLGLGVALQRKRENS